MRGRDYSDLERLKRDLIPDPSLFKKKMIKAFNARNIYKASPLGSHHLYAADILTSIWGIHPGPKVTRPYSDFTLSPLLWSNSKFDLNSSDGRLRLIRIEFLRQRLSESLNIHLLDVDRLIHGWPPTFPGVLTDFGNPVASPVERLSLLPTVLTHIRQGSARLLLLDDHTCLQTSLACDSYADDWFLEVEYDPDTKSFLGISLELGRRRRSANSKLTKLLDRHPSLLSAAPSQDLLHLTPASMYQLSKSTSSTLLERLKASSSHSSLLSTVHTVATALSAPAEHCMHELPPNYTYEEGDLQLVNSRLWDLFSDLKMCKDLQPFLGQKCQADIVALDNTSANSSSSQDPNALPSSTEKRRLEFTSNQVKLDASILPKTSSLRLLEYILLKGKVHFLWMYVIREKVNVDEPRRKFFNYASSQNSKFLEAAGLELFRYEGDLFAYRKACKSILLNTETANILLRKAEMSETQEAIAILSTLLLRDYDRWYLFTDAFMMLAKLLHDHGLKHSSSTLTSECHSFLTWYQFKLTKAAEWITRDQALGRLDPTSDGEFKKILAEKRQVDKLHTEFRQHFQESCPSDHTGNQLLVDTLTSAATHLQKNPSKIDIEYLRELCSANVEIFDIFFQVKEQLPCSLLDLQSDFSEADIQETIFWSFGQTLIALEDPDWSSVPSEVKGKVVARTLNKVQKVLKF